MRGSGPIPPEKVRATSLCTKSKRGSAAFFLVRNSQVADTHFGPRFGMDVAGI